jgi:uncharacterized coiled-coil protein SlyX
MPDERCLWQNGIDQKLLEHHEMLQDHNRRITDLSVKSEEQKELLDAHREMLAANAEHMKKIADNTDEMVDIFKGAKAFRKFAFWVAPYLAAVAAIWGAIRYGWDWLVSW